MFLKNKVSRYATLSFMLLSTISFVSPSHATSIPPVILEVSPNSGDIDGGNTLTITGQNFVESTRVKVGSTFVPDVLVSSSQLTIVMPSRTSGFVSIMVVEGMVGAVLPNAYEYVDIPDPEPTPVPPTPTPEPTPTPSPSPSASLIPDPDPVQEVQRDDSVPSIITIESEEKNETVQEPVSAQSNNTYSLYNGNVIIYVNKSTMNIVVDPIFTKRFRFTLQKKVNGNWQSVQISYRNNVGRLSFSGIPLEEARYRIVNSAKALRWFTYE